MRNHQSTINLILTDKPFPFHKLHVSEAGLSDNQKFHKAVYNRRRLRNKFSNLQKKTRKCKKHKEIYVFHFEINPLKIT